MRGRGADGDGVMLEGEVILEEGFVVVDAVVAGRKWKVRRGGLSRQEEERKTVALRSGR